MPEPHVAVTHASEVPPPPAFTTQLDRDHPLVGKIWSTRAARFVDERTLRARLRGYVLLGEKHDNPDHHVLQARLVDAMLADGRSPAVAFEMLALATQPRLDEATNADAEAIVHEAWAHSGWPDFEMYAPVVRAAVATKRPLVATGIAPTTMRAIVREGTMPPEVAEPVPLDEEQKSSLREELVATHCGHLPASMVDGMIRAQRARDATMAHAMTQALRRGNGATDAVLVAGTGHVRRDRGVPRDLAAHDATRPLTSIAFVEVEHDRREPAAYAERWNARTLPFDFVWFTPRASDEDPCAGMKR